MRKLLPLSFALLLVFTYHQMSASPDPLALSLGQAMNMASKQCMLSQRMGKAFVLKAQGIDPEKTDNEINTSAVLFDENLRLLKEFTPTAEVTQSLKKVEANWAIYKAMITGNANKENAIKALASSDELLVLCQDVVSTLQQYVQKQAADPKKNNEAMPFIQLAGQQRMGSQKLCLYYASYFWSFPREKVVTPLRVAFNDIEDALNQLHSAPVNNVEIDDAVSAALDIWSSVRDNYDKLFRKEITLKEMLEITNKLLIQMDKITTLYEAL